MRTKGLIFLVALILGAATFLGLGLANAAGVPATISAPTLLRTAVAGLYQPDSYKGLSVPKPDAPLGVQPDHLTHPCGGAFPEPPFQGLSPLSITYVPNMCNDGYGDIGVWQAGGHNYVVLSGFAQRMFHIFNVDDPYNPQVLRTQSFPAGGTTSTSIFPFRQGANQYVSVTMRGSGTGCGFFVYNVNDPANPVFVARKQGADWCTPHEQFVSTDANGDADYAWLAMSGESGSGYKVVVLDIRDLSNIVETGRYQRPDSNGSNFVHDVTVIGNRVFLAHWSGGLIIEDKETLAHSINPTPLNPIDSIRPSNFRIHHAWPTSDGNHVFIEDEFINSPSSEKVKMYNIADLNAPYYETGIIGPGVAASNSAHNLKILNQSPGRDLLFVAWYEAGTYGFQVDTTGPSPVITPTISHQIRQTTDGEQGNAWGVDYLPCTLRGLPETCVYTGDLVYGLIADALGYDASLDPYKPESQITDPTQGQVITGCSYTIRGNAHDYYSGLAQVEVSTDNGATWQLAQGTTNWTYSWAIQGSGPFQLKARARDLAGNYEVPTFTVNVTLSAPCGATPSATASETPQATTTSAPTSTPTYAPTSTAAATGTETPVATSTTISTVTPVATETPSPGGTITTLPTETSTQTPLPATPTITSTGTPISCNMDFVDVNSGDWYYPYVQYLYCNNVITGYDTNPPCADGSPCFEPNNNTTRGQLSKIAVLGFNMPINTQGGPHFSDVRPGDTFYDYIETLFNAGAITGYDDGTFRPNNPVTRGQITKIVVLAAAHMDPAHWQLQNPANNTFEDVPSGSTFFQYMETAYSHGILGGYPCGAPPAGECIAPDNKPYFVPYNQATRAQISKIEYLAATNTPARK
ncbi:MAG: S-layer homology domain-containing protein [Chloroflexi bacterium]|nr:S-layer homology domain-containing protein [Chloroflexota bacterium]